MEVFLSWSGIRSEKIAGALREWLPKVIQTLQPWMSAADIEKGTRWSQDIAVHLEQSKLGLICLTSDNLDAPWVLFEAGALSKALDNANVIPYLYQVTPSQLQGPLTQFQTVEATKNGTKGMLQTINRLLEENSLSEVSLDEAFKMWWPHLEEALAAIPSAIGEETPIRTDRDLLEEILSLQRNQSRRDGPVPMRRQPGRMPADIISIVRQGNSIEYTLTNGEVIHSSAAVPLDGAFSFISERSQINARRPTTLPTDVDAPENSSGDTET